MKKKTNLKGLVAGTAAMLLSIVPNQKINSQTNPLHSKNRAKAGIDCHVWHDKTMSETYQYVFTINQGYERKIANRPYYNLQWGIGERRGGAGETHLRRFNVESGIEFTLTNPNNQDFRLYGKGGGRFTYFLLDSMISLNPEREFSEKVFGFGPYVGAGFEKKMKNGLLFFSEIVYNNMNAEAYDKKRNFSGTSGKFGVKIPF